MKSTKFPKTTWWRTEMYMGWVERRWANKQCWEGSWTTETAGNKPFAHHFNTEAPNQSPTGSGNNRLHGCKLRTSLYIIASKYFIGIPPTWSQFTQGRPSLNIESLYILSLSGDVQTRVLTPTFAVIWERLEGLRHDRPFCASYAYSWSLMTTAVADQACHCFQSWFVGIWRIWWLFPPWNRSTCVLRHWWILEHHFSLTSTDSAILQYIIETVFPPLLASPP